VGADAGAPPDRRLLEDGGVVVWSAALERLEGWEPRAPALLGPAELERVERFLRPVDRQRYLLGRVMLRTLAGAYLATAPEALRLQPGWRGKPAFADDPNLQFNISHSGQLVLCAFAAGRAVGVDVEAHRPLPERDALARRFFAPDENLALQRLDADQRTAAFFRCWTRKEALLKAWGGGISMALSCFAVPVESGQHWPAPALHPETKEQWELWDLPAPDGYAAAAAAEGTGNRLHLREWRGTDTW
jgi:4'-phosphopantetheinyl transferase